MKRLILRIAALGTVVVLGLIAIAQAQRGAEDSPPPADKPILASVDPLNVGAPKPLAPPADSPSRRRGRIRIASPKNPLRSKSPPATPTRKVPPAKVLPADHQVVEGEDEGEILDPPVLKPPSRGQPAADRYADRYPDRQQGSLPTREPAPFRLDPFTNQGGISRLGTAAERSSSPSPDAAAPTQPPPTDEGSGQPGSKQLEGPQSPHLTIQKFAPEKIQVGRPATFRVTVRNTGTVAAAGVEVHDRVPKGTRLIGSTPRASRSDRDELVWNLGTIEPGGQSTVEVQLMPIAEGEIGSVATVHFGARASARSIATKPELVLRTSAPRKVLIGEKITLVIELSNSGSGVATGVVLEEHIPSGLQHPAGGDLQYEVGDLPAGESRKLELILTASRPGPITNVLIARGEGNLMVEDRLNLEVTAPQLDIALDGPKRRYLEREATYRLSVHNPGTAAAQHVELVAYLPTGLKFLSANNAGHYEEVNRAVHWKLEELPMGETGTVELVTMPIEAGQQKIRLRGTAERELAVEKEQPVLIEGIAAIMFTVADVTDPIGVGGETTYEIRVLNQGSKAATNVRLAVLLPAEMRPVAAEGPTRNAVDGNQVLFEGLPRLAPKADTTYRVRAHGLKPGDLRIRVQLLTDEMRSPVTKEESTRVYSDD